MTAKKRHLTPAEYVTLIFGGVRARAANLDNNKSPGCYWKLRQARGARNRGEVPPGQWGGHLGLAKKEKKPITEKDLLHGRDLAYEHKTSLKIPK